MPLYEYECAACHHRFEEQQRLADKPLVKCPTCGKNKLEKVISATAFHLKGGGWYKDLYASNKPGSSSEVTSSTPAGTTKAETKSDSKAETSTKSEPKSETPSAKSEPKAEKAKKPSSSE